MIEDIAAGKDYYAILEVAQDSSAGELKKAFRKQTLKWCHCPPPQF